MKFWTLWKKVITGFILAHLALALWLGPIPVTTIAIAEAALFSWCFVFMFSLVKGWWGSSAGVELMSLAVFIALLTSLSLLPDDWGFDGTLAEWVTFVILTGMATIALNLLRMLVKEQWRLDKKRRRARVARAAKK